MQSPIRPKSTRLPQIFSAARIRLGTSGLAEAERGKRVDVVIGRELCLYSHFDVSRMPTRERASFLDLAVRRAAPFSDPEFATAWIGDVAHVWFWSRERIASLLDLQPGATRRLTAEALLIGAAETGDACQIFALEHGFEARAWKAGRLIADRWWPTLPSEGEWAVFLRDNGIQNDIGLPLPLTGVWQDAPWGRKSYDFGALVKERQQGALPIVAAVLVAGLLGLVGFELGAAGRAANDVWRINQVKAAEEKAAANVLAARSAADASRSAIEDHLALLPPQRTIAMLAEVTRLMPPNEYKFVSWVQPNSDHLEVIASGAHADPKALVTAWEASPMFREVNAQLDEATKRVTVKAKVIASAPAGGAASAAAPEAPVAHPQAADQAAAQPQANTPASPAAQQPSSAHDGSQTSTPPNSGNGQ